MPNYIELIKVLKNVSASSLYREKRKKPLHMIDGQVTGEFSMSKLSADKINSISAYKDIESIKL